MAGLEEMKEKVVKKVDSMRSEVIETAEHIFDNPELGGEERETVRYLTGRLKEHGFDVQVGAGGMETAGAQQRTLRENPVHGYTC
jgi:metal-dependent amidase/aminoacylase/carboxypeptidase family protein